MHILRVRGPLSFAFEVTFLADVIAAGNIARRAAVNRPYCSETDSSAAPEQGCCLEAAVVDCRKPFEWSVGN